MQKVFSTQASKMTDLSDLTNKFNEIVGSGIILGIIYLKTTQQNKGPSYCIFVAIVLGVTYIHYTLMPKSTYMLDHIETAEQAQAWLQIYRKMKKTCHMGMVLGVVALPFICLIV